MRYVNFFYNQVSVFICWWVDHKLELKTLLMTMVRVRFTKHKNHFYHSYGGFLKFARNLWTCRKLCNLYNIHFAWLFTSWELFCLFISTNTAIDFRSWECQSWEFQSWVGQSWDKYCNCKYKIELWYCYLSCSPLRSLSVLLNYYDSTLWNELPSLFNSNSKVE